MGQGANGQIITTSNHVGTHMDGEIHFHASGRSIGDVPMKEWVGPGVVVDISDQVGDYDLYTPEMLMKKAEIKKGDILVTKFTDTGWTSRFSSLGGLITEHGGILCHGSIVAREYKLPCIVSAKNVTKLIKDGSTIHMNGETGEIEWISD